jgi:hypothetical protein
MSSLRVCGAIAQAFAVEVRVVEVRSDGWN